MSVQIDGSTGNIIATKADYSGNVSIGGTLTYEDVTNIDSVGLITARNGIKVDDLGVQVGTGATVDSAAANTLTFLTGGSETARFTSGSITFKAPDGGSRYLFGEMGNSANAELSLYNSSDAQKVRISAGQATFFTGGQVIIGATSSDGLFSVHQSTSSTANYINITNDATGSSSWSNGMLLGNNTSGDALCWQNENSNLLFGTNNVERMRIDSSGNLLIGTTSATSELTVKGGGTVAAFEGTGGSASIMLKDVDDSSLAYIVVDGGNLKFQTSGSSYSDKLSIDTAGRVLIGTSSARNTFYGATTIEPQFQIESAGAVDDNRMMSIVSNPGDTGGYAATLLFGRSRSATANGVGALGENDPLGQISFQGADSQKLLEGANISAVCDAAIQSAGEMPGRLVFSTTADGASSPTERMRITNLGRIRANTVQEFTGEKYHFYNGENLDGMVINENTTQNYTALHIRHGRGGLSGFSAIAVSFRGNDSSQEGSIVINTSSVSYNTSSDYRLKENQQPITDGIDRLKQLSPYRFNFIKDPGVVVDGFFAHEAQTVVPESVTGEKDGEEMQCMDHSKLVPLLTSALKEAITKIETLESEVAALKG